MPTELPKLYRVWINMRQRCNNPNAQYYADYGGRGVTICPEWDSFQVFKAWAKQAGYAEGLTLDREGNGLLYSPANCRWVDRQTQQRNRRGQRGSTSSYVGVSFNKRDSVWQASIKLDGKPKALGTFKTALEAAIARDSYIVQNQLQNFTMNNVI